MDNMIGSIYNIHNNILYGQTSAATGADSDVRFEGILDAAINMFKETSAAENYADSMQADFVMGNNDDILGVMIAQEKAYTSLQFTVQVTNKVLQAYQELMRIQL